MAFALHIDLQTDHYEVEASTKKVRICNLRNKTCKLFFNSRVIISWSLVWPFFLGNSQVFVPRELILANNVLRRDGGPLLALAILSPTIHHHPPRVVHCYSSSAPNNARKLTVIAVPLTYVRLLLPVDHPSFIPGDAINLNNLVTF